AGGFDLLAGALAEGVRRYLELGRKLAVAENLDAVLLADEAQPDERLRRHGLIGREAALLEERTQPGEVDRRVLDAEGILEAVLRDAALERHLAALEPRWDLGAGAALLALVTLGGGG